MPSENRKCVGICEERRELQRKLSVERAFSMLKFIVRDHRCCLSPSSFDGALLLKSCSVP